MACLFLLALPALCWFQISPGKFPQGCKRVFGLFQRHGPHGCFLFLHSSFFLLDLHFSILIILNRCLSSVTPTPPYLSNLTLPTKEWASYSLQISTMPQTFLRLNCGHERRTKRGYKRCKVNLNKQRPSLSQVVRTV